MPQALQPVAPVVPRRGILTAPERLEGRNREQQFPIGRQLLIDRPEELCVILNMLQNVQQQQMLNRAVLDRVLLQGPADDGAQPPPLPILAGS